jgi:predicted AAA+ superfamily ATPase
MDSYIGERLKAFLSQLDDRDYGTRDCFADLMDFVTGTRNGRIMCLTGLRRTGKTVMMHQCMRALDDMEHTLYILCEDGDWMHDIYGEIGKYLDCRYIFLDEATKCENFIRSGSRLADIYAATGKKVVAAGTDSLGFIFARTGELYGRMESIHTTYIPYREFHRLLGLPVEDHIRYGGTLCPSDTFYNRGLQKEYTDSAIAYNIMHSLERLDNGRSFGPLEEAYRYGDFVSYVSRVLEMANRKFFAGIINAGFRSHDMGSLRDLMERHTDADVSFLSEEETKEQVRIFLGIRDPNAVEADDGTVQALIRYLEKLDLLYKVPGEKDEYIFTQPGMRYAQLKEEKDALMSLPAFGKQPPNVRKILMDTLEDDICGRMLEDIVLLELLKDLEGSALAASRYRNASGGEYDIVVKDRNTMQAIAIEVKHSGAKHMSQRRHLSDPEMEKDFTESTGYRLLDKAILYNGPSEEEKTDGVWYLNVSDFLIHAQGAIRNLFSGQRPFEEARETVPPGHEEAEDISRDV